MLFLKNSALENKRGFAIRHSLIFIFFLCTQILTASAEPAPRNTHKKKIMILTSSGGGGHLSVTQALKEYIDGKYETQSVFIFSEILGELDPSINFLGKKGEDFYNYCMQKKWFSVLNSFYTIGSWYYWFKKEAVEKAIFDFLQKHKPDMVISVVPIINGHVLTVAQKLNIPFLLIPTDLDMKTFVHGIKKPNYNKFHFMAPFQEAYSLNTITKAHIPADQISVGGFPLKKTFFAPKNISRIKKEFGIRPGKPVILLLMGAMGTNNIIRFSRLLSYLKSPAHIVVCLGKNENARAAIKNITLPSHLGMTIVGFTNRIADLMSVADILITKSGSVSFSEGIYMNVPMILDSTSNVLKWEMINHTIASLHLFGISMRKGKDIITIVDDLLLHPQKLSAIKQNLEAFDKKNGGQEALKIIDRMLASESKS